MITNLKQQSIWDSSDHSSSDDSPWEFLTPSILKHQHSHQLVIGFKNKSIAQSWLTPIVREAIISNLKLQPVELLQNAMYRFKWELLVSCDNETELAKIFQFLNSKDFTQPHPPLNITIDNFSIGDVARICTTDHRNNQIVYVIKKDKYQLEVKTKTGKSFSIPPENLKTLINEKIRISPDEKWTETRSVLGIFWTVEFLDRQIPYLSFKHPFLIFKPSNLSYAKQLKFPPNCYYALCHNPQCETHFFIDQNNCHLIINYFQELSQAKKALISQSN